MNHGFRYEIFGKPVVLDEQVRAAYEELYGEPVSELDIRYNADISDCTSDMDSEELSRRINDALAKELQVVLTVPHAIEEAKQKGLLVDA